jgi:hypothetical protein
LLRQQGDLAYESNPLADWFLQSYGWAGLAVFKGLTVLLAAGIFVVVARYRPRTGAGVLNCACGLVGLVVFYSCLLVWFPATDPERAAIQEFSRRLDEQAQECRNRQDLMLRLGKDLVDRRRTLAGAVEAMHQAKLADDPIMLKALQTHYADRPEPQGMALYLAQFAVDLVGTDRTAAVRVARRLEKEFRMTFRSPAPRLAK